MYKKKAIADFMSANESCFELQDRDSLRHAVKYSMV
jgi:hypothetical protein